MIKSILTHCILFFGCLFVLTQSNLNAQQTVFSENFNAPGTPQNSSFTTAGPIGSSLWNVTRSGSDLGARIDGGMLTLTNDTSSSANFSGWVMASTSTSNYSSVYKSVLSQNSGVVSWTFNMRQIRTNPGGFAYGKYGVAFILAGTPGITNSAGKGYAVVLGQSTTTDPIRLATFSNGLASISPKLSSKATLGDFGAEYSSVRVEYNPSNNKWTLYVRKDNATSFLDPKSGSLVYQDEAVITDFVSESLTTTGAFWNAGIVKSQTSFFDNISVSVQTPELVSLNPDSKIANTGAFTLTLNGNGFLPTSKVYWNGSSRTATFISSTQLTAAIPATDISLPGTAQITVGTGTYTSNALPFTIEPSGVPALMLSTTSLAAVSTVSGTASAPPGTYTINGANLVGDATVTAPANFEISRDGSTYASSLVLPYSGGILTVQPLTLRARLSSTAMPGNYSGNITHSTSGAVTKLVAVSGRVLAVKPTLNASGITFSNITSAGFKATWANGNGTQRLVLIKELSAVNSFPVDGVTYNANAAFGAGSQMGTGNYTVYKGSGNSVQISSLKPATAYYISVVEFNGGAAGTENYLSPGTAANTTTLNKPVGLQIRAVDTSYKINFDDTVDGVNLDTFQGFGMSAIVESGQLDSNAWAFSGFSSDAIAFGGNSMEDSSYENGISDGGEEDTGIYGFNVGTATSENYTLGIQPGGSGSTADFNPGTVTLRIQNQTGAVMTGLNVGYKVYIYNDQAASSKIGFSYGANPTDTYTDQPFVEVVSPATADLAPGWKAYYRVATITGLNVAKDAYYYLRWSGSLVSGSGAQDEFGIDDIEVIANSATNTVAFDGVAEDFVLQGNAGLSADLSVQRLLFNGGKLAIKDKTLTLTGDVVNSTANGLTGGVAAKLVIRGSRNPLLSFDQTIPGTTNIFDAFSILGTNGNTVAAANTFSVNTLLKIDEPKILNLGTNVIGGTLTSIQNNGLIQTQNTTATPFPANKTWNGNGILNLNAAAGQTLVAGTYTNLKLSSAAGTTATGDLTVNGILDLPAANASATKGSLDMGLFTLTMGGDGTNTGVGEVTGIIKRNSFVNNKLYTFGHPNSSIIFPVGGTLPTTMSAKLTMGIAPSWRAGSIQRQFDIIQSGASGTKAIIRQHYLDNELNGNAESKLVFWVHNSTAPVNIIEQGRSNNNMADNWVEITNADIGLYFQNTFDKAYITLDETEATVLTWNGSASNSWTTSTNWSPTGTPSFETKVIIPNVAGLPNQPFLNPVGEIGAIVIEAGGILNAPADAQLTVFNGAGAWQNNGTFNPGTGTGKITFRNTDATVAGNTTFNNLEIASGAALRALENNVMRIEGTFTNNGTLQAGLVPNTIDYAKAGQTVPSPNSTTGGSYFNLKISGANTTVPANLNIRGNLTLDQYVDFTGKTVNMTGTVSQTIGGSAVINFNDLTVNKATEAVVLAQDIAVNGTLSLTSGNVMIDSKNLTLGTNAVAGTFGVNTMIVAQGTGMVRRAFTNTGSYLYPVGALTRTVSYSPVTVDVTAGSFSNAFVGVNVTNAKHPDNKSVRNYLRKYWNVQQTGITGAVATVNATYEASDIIGTEAAIASAQLTGTFNSSTNPWIKFGYLAGNKVSAANVILGEGQTSVFTGLQAGALSLEVYGYGNFCSGTAPTMNAVISGGDAPFTYEWSHGLGDTAAVAVPTTVVGITNYTLTVRDANGFVATDTTIPVEILPASVGGIIAADIQQICAGSLATDLQLNGSVGQVLYWQKSTDPNFGTFENLPNVTTTLTGEQIGPLTETTYFRAVIQNGGCAESRSSVAKVLIESTTWNGPVSGWSNGEPDSLKGMVFAADYMTAPNILTSACSCEVKSGATLTVVADSHITVQNGIVNNGNITVESDASVVQISDTAVNTGSVLVKRNLSFRNDERKEYNYLISPVEGSNLKTDIYKNASGSAVSTPFALYHVESDNKFYNSSGAYVQGRALAVKEPLLSSGAVPTAFFQGKPFNGLLSYPLAYSGATMGYNLVGNPYPSNIDLNMLFADNSGQIETTFRFWDNTVNEIYEQQGNAYKGNAYAIYNAAAGTGGTGLPAPGLGQGATGSSKIPNKITKVGQGFMVKSLGANKVLNYSNHIRLADNTGAFFYGKERKDDRYWLQMTAPSGITSTLAVVYFGGGNKLFGTEDSKILDNSDEIYSKAGEEKVSINGSSNFVNTDVVALGMKGFAAGQYRISLREREGVFANGQSIYLKDKYTGAITNLSEGGYVFNAGAGESTGRFEILYQPEAVLAADHSVREELAVYRDGRDFVVKAKNANITDLELFDMAGRLIYKILPNNKKAIINAELLSNGAYLLKVHQNGQVTARKIIK